MSTRLQNKRRGVSLVEVITAAALTLLLTLGLAAIGSAQSRMWQGNTCKFDAQAQAQRAIQRIAPAIREARSVVVSQSGTTRLTLQMPAYNASNRLIVPLQNGDMISYYTSDTTGNPARGGNILWRSVNGQPDQAWSLRGGKGRILLGGQGLRFSYIEPSNPASVVLSFTSLQKSSTIARTFDVQQEVMLRNRGY